MNWIPKSSLTLSILWMVLLHLVQCNMHNIYDESYNNKPQHHTPDDNKIHVDRKDNPAWNVRHVVDEMFGVFGFDFADAEDEELDFQYFSFHDLDSNNLLDGLELMLALGHGYGGKRKEGDPIPTIAEQHLSHMELDRTADSVDRILLEDDINNDGFLDYTEFRKSVQRLDGLKHS